MGDKDVAQGICNVEALLVPRELSVLLGCGGGATTLARAPRMLGRRAIDAVQAVRYPAAGAVARHERARHPCPAADWMPESLDHAVLLCPHPAMAALQTWVRTKLTALADEVADVAARAAPDCDVLCEAPDFSDDGALMVCLMLETSHRAVPTRAMPAAAAPVVAGDIASRRFSNQNMQ